jgi:hypothetical protein
MSVLCCCLGCSRPSADKAGAITPSVDFEGGAGRVRIGSGDDIRFTIPPDVGGPERLWFFFRVTSQHAVMPEFILDDPTNAHQPNWDIVRPVLSADRSVWVRAEKVSYKIPAFERLLRRKREFRFRSPLMSNVLWVAYFYPYTADELRIFLGAFDSDRRVRLSSLGLSEEGRDIPLVSIDDASPTTSTQDIWIICREHPGETPASFVLEGLVNALLKTPAGQKLLARYRFNIVPILNVDGVAHGNYYRNRGGVNLSLDWGTFKSAEVRSLYTAMRSGLEGRRVSLVVNLHSANSPAGHFFLETPAGRLSRALQALQHSLFQAADGVHPQLQVRSTVPLLEEPGIAGNYLNTKFQVYCLYSESNYSVGADSSLVTPESLQGLGSALVGVMVDVLAETR